LLFSFKYLPEPFMSKITYVDDAGATNQYEVPAGNSVMQGAVQNGVFGIPAECGGACACATCQVYVDAAWRDRVAPMQALEESMLDDEVMVANGIRLSCQIPVTPELDGLIVRVPIKKR
jgi:ferredoxin, 2Fe-2S